MFIHGKPDSELSPLEAWRGLKVNVAALYSHWKITLHCHAGVKESSDKNTVQDSFINVCCCCGKLWGLSKTKQRNIFFSVFHCIRESCLFQCVSQHLYCNWGLHSRWLHHHTGKISLREWFRKFYCICMIIYIIQLTSLTLTLSEKLRLIDKSSTGSKGENIGNRECCSRICT